jgi:hypothetical protein
MDDAPEIQTWKPSDKPVSRYPELSGYLHWLSVAATVMLVSSLSAAGLFGIVSLFSGEITTAVISFVTFGVGGVLSYFWSMAAIEVAKVIMDIEANTRIGQ